MKIAILSDIHDNVWALDVVLKNIGDAEALICCGDLCSPFIVGLLAEGFPGRSIHIVFGNNDGDLFRIAQNAVKYEHVKLHGAFFGGELGGKRIAVNHYPEIALPIAASGGYDLVCYGHNHVFKIETIGNTLAVNPGTVMGYDPGSRQDVPATWVLYNSDTHTAQGYRVPPAGSGSGQPVAYP